MQQKGYGFWSQDPRPFCCKSLTSLSWLWESPFWSEPSVFFCKKGWHSQCSVAQLCPTLCNPMDCSPLGSSVHGILQARIMEWDAIPSFRASSWPRDRTQVSCIAGRFFIIWSTREACPPRKPVSMSLVASGSVPAVQPKGCGCGFSGSKVGGNNWC